MAENKLTYLSTDPAVQVFELTDIIKGDYSLSYQLERNVQSIKANVREARYSHSRPRFE